MPKRRRRPSYPDSPIPKFRGKQPRQVVVLGARFHVKTWREVLLRTCEEVLRQHPRDFGRILELRGHTRKWFSVNPEEVHDPMPIDDSGIYAETNRNANGLVLLAQHVMASFGMEPIIEVTVD